MKRLITITLSLIVLVINTINAQNKALRIEEVGTGKPIILLPGFATSSSVWDQTIENLKGNHKFIKVTYAGFDGVAPVELPWYPKLVDDLLSYINDNKLNDIQIIAHSMGGNLAIDLAAQLGKRVSKMILVDALPCIRETIMPGVPASAVSYDNPYSNQMIGMPKEDFSQMAMGMAAGMTNQADKIGLLSQWIAESDRTIYVHGYTDLLKIDQRELLGGLKVETLIIGAPQPSKAEAEETLNNQFAKLEHKQLVMAPENTKHFIMFDASQWFYNQVNSFLQ